MNATPSPQTVHGTALVIGEAGILLRGEAGAGKTGLALDLIARLCAQGRFARLVADDRVRLHRRHGRIIVSTPERIAGCAELRGAGIARDLPFLAAAVLRLVVDLDEAAPRYPVEGSGRITLNEADVMHLRLRRADAAEVIDLLAARGFSKNACFSEIACLE